MSMDHPFVDRELMNRVIAARGRTLEDVDFSDLVNITDLFYKAINFTEEEMIASVVAALEVRPDMVYQILAYDRAELLRKGKKNETNQCV